jgi:hypothetical protein
MGRYATRSVFAAALCAGVAMVGASVNGLMGVDAQLERSALAAQHQTIEKHTFRVNWRPDQQRGWDCPGQAPEPPSKQRV